MPGKADEGGMPGRILTEENAARRRLGGVGPDKLPGVSTNAVFIEDSLPVRSPGE